MGPGVLWTIVLGFLVGVFLRSLAPLGLSFAAFLSLLGLCILSISFVERPRRRTAALVALVFFACAGGVVRMNVAIVSGAPSLSEHLGSEVTIEGVVSNEPDAREASTRIPVRAEMLVTKSGTTTADASVLVVASSHVGVFYGDRVRAKGVLRLPEAFETGEGRQFNYPAFLAKDGIVYELAFAEVETMGDGSRNILKAAAIFLKQKYLEGIALALPEPHAGLAGGITAGDKRGLGEELSNTFRTVGLTHIIVLSGYNIMIVVFGLGWLLHKLHAPRASKIVLGISVAAFFALITGLAAASVRAAAMASIALVGQYTGRVYLAARALALVAAAMVAWNPYVLAFDIGFQLSVIATAGLITLTPHIAPRLTFVTTALNLREVFATTLAAQLAVLPLLLYQSGALPLYTLPVNLLVLVAVPWAMLLSALAALAGLILGPLAPVVAFPAYVLLAYAIGVAQLFASLPFASLTIPAFSAWWLVLVYGTLLGVVAVIKKNHDGVKGPAV